MSPLLLAIFIVIPLLIFSAEEKNADENSAKLFLKNADKNLAEKSAELGFAQWDFNTDINDINEKKVLEKTAVYNKFMKDLWKNAMSFDWNNFTDYSVRRQFEKLSVLGFSALDEEDSNRFTNISTTMEKIYSSATVCVKDNCNLDLQPDLTKIMSKSRDYSELKETWTNWRNSAGKPIRELYKEYVKLGNKAAVINGFKTLDDLWLFPWETPDFKEQIESLWQQIEPTYKKLHAFVRKRLRQHYGNQMPSDGTIPAHILGNMWSQSWSNILDLLTPFADKQSVDVTQSLISQNYTALQMFGLSEKFFRDLGLLRMPLEFWANSVITKPENGRTMVCMASAWDFHNRKDFRIKMCTEVNMEDLVVIHHEMGHTEYQMLYKNQPVVFQEGANAGFHEAIGDTIALSVSTPKHLSKIGLLYPLVDDYETTVNYQMKMALEKIAFIPFSYVMDNWRWDVFSGKTSMDDLNKHWWELRIKYQGISPPTKRSESDFDPGAKFHIPAGVEYIRYFVSHIIQFQFQKALCSVAQPDVPLYECDIDGNKAAGKRLADVLKLGASKPWPEQMQLLTGSPHMSAEALIEYFDPLIKYLDKEIEDETIGWTNDVEKYMETPFDRLDSRVTKLEINDRNVSQQLLKLENDFNNQKKLIESIKKFMNENPQKQIEYKNEFNS